MELRSTEGDRPTESNRPAEGAIVLVATPIGNLGDLSTRARDTLASAQVIACEDTRRTGRLLEAVSIAAPRLICLNEHTESEVSDELISLAKLGQTVAVVTDAGTPGISDPPTSLVEAAISAGVPVDSIPGPSALLAGLSLSGLPAGRFVFEGFLPRSGSPRAQRLQILSKEQRTIVLFESPHRLKKTLRDLADSFGEVEQLGDRDKPSKSSRPAALAREITKLHQQVIRASLAELAAKAEDESFPIRGEFVIVIQGAPEAPEPSDQEIKTALQAELASGASKKDAAADVAAGLGVSRRRAYSLAVEL